MPEQGLPYLYLRRKDVPLMCGWELY